MMDGWPITNYQIAQIKKSIKLILLIPALIIIAINIIAVIFVNRIKVNPESYIIKNGFIFFISSEDYLQLIKSYPYDFGTDLTIYKIKRGESYWDIAMRNHISIDTIIAANPFIDSLLAKEGIEIVIPHKDGVLMAFDNIFDIWRMSRILGYKDSVKGEYIPSIFRLFSLDDLRFAFFEGSKPEIVNNYLEGLYKIRKLFQTPIKGYYTSLYGNRVDPFLHGISFHRGVDIKARTGTPIYPVKEGIITSAGWHGGCGLAVIIQHIDGYISMYGHCSAINVKKGTWVEKEDILGFVGSTGRSTGSHLHFSIIRHGRVMNPLLFIW